MADTYSQEEMEEILKRAMERDQEGSVGRDDLIAAAEEVGIDPKAVQAAMREVKDERRDKSREGLVLREHRRKFWPSLGRFTMLNATCLGINLLNGGSHWFWWVLLLSGLLMARKAVVTLWPSERDLTRADERLMKATQKAERRRRKREDRALRNRDRHAYERQKAEGRRETQDQFERVVEQGVVALLGAAADQLEKVNQGGRHESNRPRVRVEDELEDQDESDRHQRGRSHRR